MASSNVAYQAPEKRIKNFNEVCLGFSKKIALEEARRCPQCTDPVCIKGCPLGINIPGFIRMLREGNVSGAYEIIKEKNCLSSICGRICSAPCEDICILNDEAAPPIQIRALERYVADFGKSWRLKKEKSSLRGKKIAVVGSGPCGLTASYFLVQKGYAVTIYETFDKAGGLLRYGIPEFRIPKKILDGDIHEIKAIGVEVESNFLIGKTKTIQDLFEEGFSAVLLATGAGIPKFKDIPGTNLGGVYYGEEFLMRANLMKTSIFMRHILTFSIGERVIVIGSGNTALDSARVAKRFGKEVTMIFRRTEEEMRVSKKERVQAKEEGIQMETLVKPIEILADNHCCVRGVKCLHMDYAQTDTDDRWELAPVPDSEFVLDADTVIIGEGHNPNTLAIEHEDDIKLTREGTVKVHPETFMTSREGVFAAGNIICNSRSLVENMASAQQVAEKMDEYLK